MLLVWIGLLTTGKSSPVLLHELAVVDMRPEGSPDGRDVGLQPIGVKLRLVLQPAGEIGHEDRCRLHVPLIAHQVGQYEFGIGVDCGPRPNVPCFLRRCDGSRDVLLLRVDEAPDIIAFDEPLPLNPSDVGIVVGRARSPCVPRYFSTHPHTAGQYGNGPKSMWAIDALWPGLQDGTFHHPSGSVA